jgi:hypothetical protein
MSSIRVSNVQVGLNPTEINNVTLYQPALADGTVRFARGNLTTSPKVDFLILDSVNQRVSAQNFIALTSFTTPSIVLGSQTNKATVQYTANTSRTYTIPDINSSSFVMTEGTQTINGAKTFGSIITGSITGNAGTSTTLANTRSLWGQNFNGASDVSGNITGAGTIQFGTQSNKATLTYTTNTARTYTVPDAGANASFVMTEGTQTINGAKTFGSIITGSITGNAGTSTTLANTRSLWGQNFNGASDVSGNITGAGTIQFGTQSNKATLTYTTNTARTYTVPDAGANASFVMTEGTQPINGAKTFGSIITGSITGNAGTSTTLANTRSLWGQNFNGASDVSGNITGAGTIQFGTQSNKATLTYTTNTARTYTVPDAGANASFVMTEGTQPINGAKTFGSIITGSITGNAGTVTNGVYTTGNQTIGGVKTFSSDVQIFSLGVGTPATSTAGEIRATNNITAYFSDDRLKTKLGPIEHALEKLNTLNGFYFIENETAKSLGYSNDKVQVGVSAQEVLNVLPEVVTDAPINVNVSNADYKTVKYEKLIPLLIEAVKELTKRVDALYNS